MTYSKQRLREVTGLKREAVRRIQTDIEEIDPSPSRKYIHEFSQEFDSFEATSTPQEVLDEAIKAELIWIGDYHALTKSQLFVVEVLKHIAQHKGNVALAIEPVFARNQGILDLWISGEIPEQEFLERIKYHEEWGCEWAGYKAIFDAARQLRIPVYGADSDPRNDMRRIG